MASRKEYETLMRTLDEKRSELSQGIRRYNGQREAYAELYDKYEYQLTECKKTADLAQRKFDADYKVFKGLLTVKMQELLIKATAKNNPADIYAAVVPSLDRDGSFLSKASQKLLDIKDFFHHFVEEDSAGRLEMINGHGQVRMMELSRLGEPSYNIYHSIGGGGYELMDGGEAPSLEDPAYQSYLEALYPDAINRILKSSDKSFTVEGLLGAINRLEAIVSSETPYQADWEEYQKFVDEHQAYEYALFDPDTTPYAEAKEAIWTDLVEQWEAVQGPEDLYSVNSNAGHMKTPEGESSFFLSKIIVTQSQIDRVQEQIAEVESETRLLVPESDFVRNWMIDLDKLIPEMRETIAMKKKRSPCAEHIREEYAELLPMKTCTNMNELIKSLNLNVPPQIQDVYTEHEIVEEEYMEIDITG